MASGLCVRVLLLSLLAFGPHAEALSYRSGGSSGVTPYFKSPSALLGGQKPGLSSSSYESSAQAGGSQGGSGPSYPEGGSSDELDPAGGDTGYYGRQVDGNSQERSVSSYRPDPIIPSKPRENLMQPSHRTNPSNLQTKKDMWKLPSNNGNAFQLGEVSSSGIKMDYQPQQPSSYKPQQPSSYKPQQPSSYQPSRYKPQQPSSYQPAGGDTGPIIPSKPRENLMQPSHRTNPSNLQTKKDMWKLPSTNGNAFQLGRVSSSGIKMDYQPQQPSSYQPQQPSSYQPQQPSSYQPQQPSSYQPQQPSSYQPQQPSSYQPQQPSSYQPQQPSSYQPQQPSSYQPQQPSSYQPQQPSSYQPQQPSSYQPSSYQPSSYQPQQPSSYKPQQPSSYKPQQPSSYKPQQPSSYKPQQPSSYKPQQPSSYKPQQPSSYKPQQPSSYKPQQPSSYKPQQPSSYKPQQPSSYKPQQPSSYKPQQPSSYKPQQPSSYKPQQPSSYKPQQPSSYKPQQPSSYQPAGGDTGPIIPSKPRENLMQPSHRTNPSNLQTKKDMWKLPSNNGNAFQLGEVSSSGIQMDYKPQQLSSYQLKQPSSYQPQQPSSYQPSSYQPKQPSSYKPQQPLSYQPSSYQPAGGDTGPIIPSKPRENLMQPSHRTNPSNLQTKKDMWKLPSNNGNAFQLGEVSSSGIKVDYQPKQPSSYQPSSYQPQQPSSYQPSSYKPQQPSSYKPQQPSSYQPSSYKPQQPSSYQPSSYKPQQPSSYKPQQPSSYKPQQPSSYKPQQPSRYQPAGGDTGPIIPSKPRENLMQPSHRTNPSNLQTKKDMWKLPSNNGNAFQLGEVSSSGIKMDYQPKQLSSYQPTQPSSYQPSSYQPAGAGGDTGYYGRQVDGNSQERSVSSYRPDPIIPSKPRENLMQPSHRTNPSNLQTKKDMWKLPSNNGNAFQLGGVSTSGIKMDYQPKQPSSYKPQQPSSYQPSSYQPKQPSSYQPSSYQPKQPSSYQPQQPSSY